MTDKKNGDDSVHEPDSTYRVLGPVKDRRRMRDAARKMDEIRKRHAADPADGKDVVSLLRELRNR